MTNDEYAAAVAAGEFPADPRVELGSEFHDERGAIANILLTQVTSVARIHSVARAVRANHYHRTDWHYSLVESGRVLYFERAVGAATVPDPVIVRPGEMFFTPPMREHAMLFPEPTVIYTFARNIRDHATHEADLVRVEFVTPAVAEDVLKRVVLW